MYTLRKKCGSVGKHGLLVLLSLLAVFPLYWMVVSSFKNQGEIFGTAFWPAAPTLENYTYAFEQMPISRMLLNSFIIAIAMTALQLLTSILAAYALTRWQFKGRGILYTMLTLTWLIPAQATMIPNYIQVNEWGLQGNPLAIVLPFAASAFAVISMYQGFNQFPRALIDAARLDGAGEWQILTRVVLPPMKATISSLGILLFINSWNEYLWPMLVTKKLESAPIQIGIKSFVSSDVNMWGSLMAATTISCLPILIIYIILQRHIVDSFMKWGIK